MLTYRLLQPAVRRPPAQDSTGLRELRAGRSRVKARPVRERRRQRAHQPSRRRSRDSGGTRYGRCEAIGRWPDRQSRGRNHLLPRDAEQGVVRGAGRYRVGVVPDHGRCARAGIRGVLSLVGYQL